MRFLIHHLLCEAAERAPDQPALRYQDQTLSYAQLLRRAQGVARVLADHGVRRNDRVGLCAFKGVEAVVGMYGTLLAGAAYVPLDPVAPPARLATIADDCGIRLVVSQERKREALAQMQSAGAGIKTVVGVDGTVPGATTLSWIDVETASGDSTPAVGGTELDLAYIIYTSGTTGRPKGIVHTHRGCLSFVDWAREEYGLRPNDRLANHAPLHFDLSTFDFFASAAAGATTVVVPEPHARVPASLSKLLADERVSILYAVPAALVQLSLRGALEQRDLSALRWVIFGGEAFPTPQLRALMRQLPRARFSQVYGVTETNVCTFHHVDGPLDDDAPVPLGRVLPNMDALILAAGDRPAAHGEPGELLIRGPAVMPGYWGRADLQDLAFLHRERAPGFPEAYYRTGDRVRRLPSDDLEFLGRIDRQVKIRGFRVELEEVEGAMLSHAAVVEAVAFTVPDGDSSHRLHAAAVVREGTTEVELLTHLRDRLPGYAVPARVDLVDALPRTSAGKVDHGALRS